MISARFHVVSFAENESVQFIISVLIVSNSVPNMHGSVVTYFLALIFVSIWDIGFVGWLFYFNIIL